MGEIWSGAIHFLPGFIIFGREKMDEEERELIGFGEGEEFGALWRCVLEWYLLGC